MTVQSELSSLAPELEGALAHGLEALAARHRWSPFELDESFDDLLRLSKHEDACYDRPSAGWAYAAWYHGRRTHSAARLLAGELLAQEGSLTLVDLGGGTGATPWSVAAILVAAARAGTAAPRVSVVSVDSSPPMIDAAEGLWSSLVRSSLGSMLGELVVDFRLASWTDLPGLELPPSDQRWIVGSYLFDHSDVPLAPAIAALFERSIAEVAADKVLFTGGSSKSAVIDSVMNALSPAGWRVTQANPFASPWDGPLPEVHMLRQALYASTSRAQRWAEPPTWSSLRDRPKFHRLERKGPQRLFSPNIGAKLVLDADQEAASQPDDRLTVVVGAAGSGKSMVLVERVARTLEAWPSDGGAQRILITTFNKQMLAQLCHWLALRLVQTGRGWSPSGADGDYSFRDGRANEVRLLNIDKLPTREFDVKRVSDVNGIVRAHVDRFLRDQTGARLTEAQQNVLRPGFLESELRRVIYGLGVWHSLEDYLSLEVRAGRGVPISSQQKELIWAVTMGRGLRTFTHCRMDALDVARTLEAPPNTHVFVDECQDATPADFELLSRLVPDPNRVVVAGDEAQALHLGGSYRRPGRMEFFREYRTEASPAFRLWNAWPLEGSYRLPVRVCECVEPLARAIEEDRNQRGLDHDVSVPQAKKAAVLGVRPIVLAASNWQEGLAEIFSTFGRLLVGVPEQSRIVSVAERSLPLDAVVALAPEGLVARRESMREIKGLERACIVWATSAPFEGDESELEWVFTILTRTLGLAVLVVDPEKTSSAARRALRLLRSDRLLCWDAAAQHALTLVRRPEEGEGAVG